MRWSLVFASLALSACSMTPYGVGNNPVLRIAVDGFGNPEEMIQKFSAPMPELGVRVASSPSTIDGFNCLGFNVMGPGIASSSGHDDPAAVLARVYAGDTCAYPGVTSRDISISTAGNVVELTVPSGAARVVQVMGMRDPKGVYCGRGRTIAEAEGAGGKLDLVPFEVGRAVMDVFQSSAVGITNSYSGLNYKQRGNRVVACGGGSGQDKNPYELNTSGMVGWWAADAFETQYSEPGSGVALSTSDTWPAQNSTNSFNLSAMGSAGFVNYARQAFDASGAIESRILQTTGSIGSGAFTGVFPSTYNGFYGLTVIAFGTFNGSTTNLAYLNDATDSVALARNSGPIAFVGTGNALADTAPMTLTGGQRAVVVGRIDRYSAPSMGWKTCLYANGSRCSPTVGQVHANSGPLLEDGSASSITALKQAATGDELVELMVFQRKISDEEVERVFDYFRLKYGIP